MCSIGGNLGTNAGGLCCVKYGQTRDSVLVARGRHGRRRVIRTGGRNVKDVAGYALTHLFVGQPGDARDHHRGDAAARPAPPPRSTMLAFFPTLDGGRRRGGRDRGRRARRRSRSSCSTGSRSRAVDDMNDLGLDREAAAMLMVESDMPGVAGDRRARPGRGRLRAAGATDVVRARRRAGGRLAAPGPAGGALRARAARRGPDGGRRRAALAGARSMLRAIERIAAKHGVRIGDVRPRRRRQPPPGPRLRARRPARRGADRSASRRTSTGPPSTSAARSRASTASAWPGASGSSRSVAPDAVRRHARDQGRARPARASSTRGASSRRLACHPAR